MSLPRKGPAIEGEAAAEPAREERS
jgi:hypothetical protein